MHHCTAKNNKTATASSASTHHLGDSLPRDDLDCQTQIRKSALALAVQQHILGLHVAIHNIHFMQMQNASSDLRRVVDDALHLNALVHTLAVVANVVDVVLEVSSVHQGHHKAQMGLGVIRVGQVDQEQAVDLLQDLLLQQGHLFSALLLQSLFTQLLASVHLACVFHLDGAHLEKDGKMVCQRVGNSSNLGG